jgi:hypothetical protein
MTAMKNEYKTTFWKSEGTCNLEEMDADWTTEIDNK